MKTHLQRMDRKTLEQSYHAASTEALLYRIALIDMTNEAITWLDWRKADEATSYRYGFARLDTASGGYLIHIFRHTGQTDTVRVEYLDGAHVPTEYRRIEDVIRIDAIEKAKNARYRLMAA